jgi:hypothetical protein
MVLLILSMVATINLTLPLTSIRYPKVCFLLVCHGFVWQQIILCVRVILNGLCEKLCCYGVCERLNLRRVTLAMQNTLQCMFKSIGREGSACTCGA